MNTSKFQSLIVTLFLCLILLGIALRGLQQSNKALDTAWEALAVAQRSQVGAEGATHQINKACITALQLTSRPTWHLVDLHAVAPDDHSGPSHYVFVDMTSTVLGKLEPAKLAAVRNVKFTFRIDSGVRPEMVRDVTDLVYVQPVD